jgi:hypothetical protein
MRSCFLEAEEWISSNDNGVFSFNNVCETLGFDPDALRKVLRRSHGKENVSFQIRGTVLQEKRASQRISLVVSQENQRQFGKEVI